MLTRFFCFKTLFIVQLIVGLNERIIKQGDEFGCLPLHDASQTCPETCVLQCLMSVHPQGLTTRSNEGCSPLRFLMMHDFRAGVMNCFFDIEHLQCMSCHSNNGSKQHDVSMILC